MSGSFYVRQHGPPGHVQGLVLVVSAVKTAGLGSEVGGWGEGVLTSLAITLDIPSWVAAQFPGLSENYSL